VSPVVIPLLVAVAGLGIIIAASGGGGGTTIGTIKLFNLAAGLEKWKAYPWAARVDVLRLELVDPDDVSRAIAAEVFPDYSWPATGTTPQGQMWKRIKSDVFLYMGLENPFPPG